MLRGIAVVVGLGAIAAVTHGTIMATGGYGIDTNAPTLIALALVQAVLAVTIGECLAKGRTALGGLAILVLVACEACSFIATANLQLSSIETHAASAHDAEAKYKVAVDRLGRAERSDAVQRAEAAKARVDADAIAKSAEKSCAANCRQILEAQVAAAAAAVETARSAMQREITEARNALAQTPVPGSAAPLADRLGMSASALDLLYVGLRGFAVSAGAAIVLAYGAHGRRRQDEAVLVEVKQSATQRRPPTAVTKRLAAPVTTTSSPSEEADRFARTVFRPKRGGRVALRDIRAAYHCWCSDSQKIPLADAEIGKALNELFASADLRVAGNGSEAAIVGIEWRGATV